VLVQGVFTRFYLSSATQPFVSFGQLWNSYQVSALTPPATSYFSSSTLRYNQRITTADAP